MMYLKVRCVFNIDTLNTSLVHDVLDTVATAVEKIDRVLLAFASVQRGTMMLPDGDIVLR
jgi:hypothetical protein